MISLRIRFKGYSEIGLPKSPMPPVDPGRTATETCRIRLALVCLQSDISSEFPNHPKQRDPLLEFSHCPMSVRLYFLKKVRGKIRSRRRRG